MLGAVLVATGMPSSAAAHQLTPYAWSSNFDGHDSTAGVFSSKVGPISIDQTTGRLYVLDTAISTDKASTHDWVSQFSAAGVAVPFSGLGGASSIDTGRVSNSDLSQLPFDIAVDNTPGHLGFYVLNSGISGIGGGPLRAYGFDGLERPGFPVNTNGGEAVAVDPEGNPWVNNAKYKPSGSFAGNTTIPGGEINALAFDNEGDFYVARNPGLSASGTYKYDPQGNLLFRLDVGFDAAVTIDPSDDHVFVLHGIGGDFGVTEYTPQGVPLSSFGNTPALPNFNHIDSSAEGLAVNATTHDVYVSHRNLGGGTGTGARIEIFSPQTPITVPDTTTGGVDPTPTVATVHGVVNPDNVPTADCKFEWGTDTSYSKAPVDCAEGTAFSGTDDNQVSATLPGLTLGTTYHYRLKAKNANQANGADAYSFGVDRTFQAQGPPSGSNEFASDVNNDGVRLHADVDPNGGDTTYRVQYTSEADFIANGGYGGAKTTTSAPLADNLGVQAAAQTITGLDPDTIYHYRVVATNANSTVPGPDRTFKTFPLEPSSDPCPNAHVRQQTGAALLLDCRAYELVSAPDTGGYDVESDLIAGQAPLVAYPQATDKALYSLFNGSIPDIAGSPTNFGQDPYLATRTASGWSTTYVGLPADGMSSAGPFGSPLLGADSALGEFAFGGQGICSPCFADGSINVPLRQADGTIVKGMSGSLKPAANPAGAIAKRFSADGSHFVFGATARFESAAHSGDVTIYDRDLKAAKTQIVSTLPNGSPMTGVDNAELDISKDGSRIVIGQKVATDAAGNSLYHPYMHIGPNTHSLDLAPLSTTGVLFDGMSSDGSKVFFTSKEQLIPALDTDQSADIYEADVNAAGSLSLRLVSVDHAGDPSNEDSCRPPGTLQESAWNTAYAATEGADCSALAFAGGAGVASGSGAFYFLSPEFLDTSNPQDLPVKDQPNLYLKRPGQNPSFVATIDSSLAKAPKPPATHPLLNLSLVIGQSGATGDAVDKNGSIYVLNNGTNTVRKLDPAGAAQNFTAGSNANTNTLTGAGSPTGAFSELAGAPTQIAIDRQNNYLYVPDYNHNVVDKFSTAGQYLSQVSVTQPSGVAVNRKTGDLYVSSAAGSVYEFDSAGSPLATLSVTATSLAVDVDGKIYGVSGGKVTAYEADGSNPIDLVASGVTNVAVDASGSYPYDGQLYVDEGTQIAVFDTDGAQIATLTDPNFTGSVGIAVGPNHHAYATRGGTRVSEFGFSDAPYPEIDHPAILHAISQAATHDYADFQVSADGSYAAFDTRLALTGYDNHGHSEIYRYDAGAAHLDCVSCAPTGARAASDAFLSAYGLNLTDDGKVFFTSPEPLVLRDTNAKRDAYEWEPQQPQGTVDTCQDPAGCIQLISTGASPTDSSLFSASADATDAFFFTRETLSFQDQNGARMKIYDARANGGFEFVPSRKPCAASDECHGAGTATPSEPSIRTAEPSTVGAQGSGGAQGRHCKPRFVKRGRRCVARHHKKRHPHKKRHNHRGGSK